MANTRNAALRKVKLRKGLTLYKESSEHKEGKAIPLPMEKVDLFVEALSKKLLEMLKEAAKSHPMEALIRDIKLLPVKGFKGHFHSFLPRTLNIPGFYAVSLEADSSLYVDGAVSVDLASHEVKGHVICEGSMSTTKDRTYLYERSEYQHHKFSIQGRMDLGINPYITLGEALLKIQKDKAEQAHLRAILVHEITHAFQYHQGDKVSPNGLPSYYKQVGEIETDPSTGKQFRRFQKDIPAYRNHPHEIKALIGQLADRCRGHYKRKNKKPVSEQDVKSVLSQDDFWNSWSPDITETNKRRIYRDVYLALVSDKESKKTSGLKGSRNDVQIKKRVDNKKQQQCLHDLATVWRNYQSVRDNPSGPQHVSSKRYPRLLQCRAREVESTGRGGKNAFRKMKLKTAAVLEKWNNKDILAKRGEYRIAADNPSDPKYLTLWTEDHEKVGELSTTGLRGYLGISHVVIQSEHRGNGLGLLMYQTLLGNLGPEWKGIATYLPDQRNKKQVTAIWRTLGARPHPESEDILIVSRNANQGEPLTNWKQVLDTAQEEEESISEDIFQQVVAACGSPVATYPTNPMVVTLGDYLLIKDKDYQTKEMVYTPTEDWEALLKEVEYDIPLALMNWLYARFHPEAEFKLDKKILVLNDETYLQVDMEKKTADFISDIKQWVMDLDEMEMFDLVGETEDLHNPVIGCSLKEFRENPSEVYHYTNEDALAEIIESGCMETSSGTGMTNRFAAGVFTSFDPEENEDGTYGDICLEIDLPAFLRDYPDTQISFEPEIEECLARETVIGALDIEMDASPDSSGGMSYGTIIVGASIPVKYISVDGNPLEPTKKHEARLKNAKPGEDP